MEGNFRQRLTAVWIWLCLLSLTGGMATAGASELLTAAADPATAILGRVLAVGQKTYGRDGPVVRVLELGGGDPAMNGDFLYVAIETASDCRVWKTGLNVRKLNAVTLAADRTIVLDVDQDVMAEDGSIGSRRHRYALKFFLTDGRLEPGLRLTSRR